MDEIELLQNIMQNLMAQSPFGTCLNLMKPIA